jgi:hypothetical protein
MLYPSKLTCHSDIRNNKYIYFYNHQNLFFSVQAERGQVNNIPTERNKKEKEKSERDRLEPPQ